MLPTLLGELAALATAACWTGSATFFGIASQRVGSLVLNRVRLPLNLQPRNSVGSIFGGSLYGAVDPLYMLMLIRLLGSAYSVWDKAATIRFLNPGRATLSANCRVDDAELDEIRRLLESESKIDRTYRITLGDAEGTVHAEVDKVIQIRKKAGLP